MIKKIKANKNDYDKVMKIWQSSAIETHDFLSKEDFEFYKRLIPQHLDSVILSLWYDNETLVGFSGVSESELVMLFLDPAFIGNGYGSKILTALINSDKIDTIDVNSQNESAKKFYLKHGFTFESEDQIDGFGKPYPITHLVKK